MLLAGEREVTVKVRPWLPGWGKESLLTRERKRPGLPPHPDARTSEEPNQEELMFVSGGGEWGAGGDEN